jgi:hypothetical protein
MEAQKAAQSHQLALATPCLRSQYQVELLSHAVGKKSLASDWTGHGGFFRMPC